MSSLRRLRKNEIELVQAFYCEGMSCKQIAERFHITRTTVLYHIGKTGKKIVNLVVGKRSDKIISFIPKVKKRIPQKTIDIFEFDETGDKICKGFSYKEYLIKYKEDVKKNRAQKKDVPG